MSDPVPRPRSIRRQLLGFLVLSAIVVLSGAAAITYVVAVQLTNNAYDRSLLDPALDIADNVRIDAAGGHVDLPEKALEALIYDLTDKVLFQVRSPTNTVIDGVAALPAPPSIEPGRHIFFNSTYNGEPIRVAALRSVTGFSVQVGETLHKRNRLVLEILVAELVSTLLIALASIALAWIGMTRGLRPFEKLREDLLDREPQDLRPLPAAGLPVEIAPVVSAFNDLLDHVADANTSQRRFFSNAAHQLRTPLAGLQLHLELLLRRELPLDVRAELERMQSATIRASRLANQLLALAKAEGGPDRDQERGAIDLRDVAATGARDWTAAALAKGIDLGFSLECASVVGDRLLLPEMLDNLIDNALRYTPAGGRVTVSTGQDEQASYLSVEDTGPGIPVEERYKVQERFYRVAGTPGDGSGLGLAIVREVIERHGATLEILDSATHGGTRVRAMFARATMARAQPA
jgi:two-component system sensor histidine kinase TctE